MYARLVTGHIVPEKLDEAINLWLSEVLPSVQQQAGFENVRLLVDRATCRVVTMGLWESEAHFQATAGWNEDQVAKFAMLFSALPEVGGYEVIYDG